MWRISGEGYPSDKGFEMRLLLRLATTLLLGAFIGLGTTCGGFGLGGHYRPLAATTPGALDTSASAVPVSPDTGPGRAWFR